MLLRLVWLEAKNSKDREFTRELRKAVKKGIVSIDMEKLCADDDEKKEKGE